MHALCVYVSILRCVCVSLSTLFRACVPKRLDRGRRGSCMTSALATLRYLPGMNCHVSGKSATRVETLCRHTLQTVFTNKLTVSPASVASRGNSLDASCLSPPCNKFCGGAEKIPCIPMWPMALRSNPVLHLQNLSHTIHHPVESTFTRSKKFMDCPWLKKNIHGIQCLKKERKLDKLETGLKIPPSPAAENILKVGITMILAWYGAPKMLHMQEKDENIRTCGTYPKVKEQDPY